jgi:hypothetical protein
MMPNIRRTIITATATAGSLDLLSAFVFSAMNGHGPIRVLQSVASGPFGPGMMGGGLGAALIGLVVHYTLMTVMVTVFVLAATRLPSLMHHRLLAGLAYGFGLYLVMYWIVLPLRYPAVFPQTGAWQVGNALFSHLICVGLPIGLITARFLRKP